MIFCTLLRALTRAHAREGTLTTRNSLPRREFIRFCEHTRAKEFIHTNPYDENVRKPKIKGPVIGVKTDI